MKLSTRNSYKLAYGQWGYKPFASTPDANHAPLQPRHASTTHALGKANKNGTVTVLYFHPDHINLITTDKAGRVINATHNLPYPMLANG